MKRIILFFLVFLSSCGSLGLMNYESLMDRQPKVVDVTPKRGEKLDSVKDIRITFSSELKEVSVGSSSIAIVEYANNIEEKELKDLIVKGEIKTIEGEYGLDQARTTVTFTPSEGLKASVRYAILVTDLLQNDINVPFNQNRGGAYEPFFSYFSINVGENDSKVDREIAKKPEQKEGESGGVVEPEEEVRNPPEFLVINEVFYDAVGRDTDGNVFIELYGTQEAEISGFVVNLVDGDDGRIKDVITLPADAFIPDDGIYLIGDAVSSGSTKTNVMDADFVDNFDPGNAPDAVQVIGKDGKLYDSVGYGALKVDISEAGLAILEGEPAKTVKSGESLSRVNGLDTQNNKLDFITLSTPSPGEL